MFIQDLFDQFMLETHIHRKSCVSGIPNIDLKLEWLDLNISWTMMEQECASTERIWRQNCAQVTTALTYMTNIYNIVELYTIISFKIWEMLSTKANFNLPLNHVIWGSGDVHHTGSANRDEGLHLGNRTGGHNGDFSSRKNDGTYGNLKILGYGYGSSKGSQIEVFGMLCL